MGSVGRPGYKCDFMIYIYLTAVGFTPGGSNTSHIYTQTVHIIQRKENNTEIIFTHLG
jgi:hypothetical protein